MKTRSIYYMISAIIIYIICMILLFKYYKIITHYILLLPLSIFLASICFGLNYICKKKKLDPGIICTIILDVIASTTIIFTLLCLTEGMFN